MTKMEYAKAVASQIENAEVKEVEKTNGIIVTGIVVMGNGVSPCAYIDYDYENGISVEDCVERLKAIFENDAPNFDIIWIDDYSQARSHLTARLYNAKTNAEV